MLRPHKHSHPDQTVIAASTTLLRDLRRKRIVSYDTLKGTLDTATRSSDVLFLPAVSLLHLLGLIEYRATVDSFEYVGN
jgi:hypothetical protein